MLQQIAMRMRARQAGGEGEEGEDGDNMIVIDDDNCSVSDVFRVWKVMLIHQVM
jgi:hypothetical protein